jgi:TPR repeat protein
MNLAMFYYRTPNYTPTNLTEKQVDLRIVNLLSSAAKQGHLKSKSVLAALFQEGFRSIQRDLTKAIQFHTACINEDPDVHMNPSSSTTCACAFLGSIVDQGHPGVKTVLGFTTPLEWVTFGAKHGDASCQYQLAEWYFEGKGGLDQDYALASEWLDRVFRQNQPMASALLGKMQHRGVFVRPPESEEDE